MATELPHGSTVFRLPRSHWHAFLWNFDWAGVQPASLQERMLAFLHAVQDCKAPHMLLTGSPGIGKTHLGVGAYRVATAVWGTALATWVNVPAFCERVKQSYSGGDDPWADIQEARRMVVLDDLFGRELTSHEKDQVVTRLLDTAYQNDAAVLATMNQDVGELSARLPAHEISRLLAAATVIKMKANMDRRVG